MSAATEARGVATLAGDAKAAKQAAQKAAFAAAVDAAARVLLERPPADPAKPEADPEVAAVIGAAPDRYVRRYRLLQDAGVRSATPAGSKPGAEEYVLVLDVEVDTEALEARLREAGLLAGPPPLPLSRFLVEIENPPSYPAIAAVAKSLRELGAQRVVPESFEAGRAVLAVEGSLTPAFLKQRLAGAAVAGFAIRVSATEEALVRVQVEVLPAPPLLTAPQEPEAVSPPGPAKAASETAPKAGSD